MDHRSTQRGISISVPLENDNDSAAARSLRDFPPRRRISFPRVGRVFLPSRTISRGPRIPSITVKGSRRSEEGARTIRCAKRFSCSAAGGEAWHATNVTCPLHDPPRFLHRFSSAAAAALRFLRRSSDRDVPTSLSVAFASYGANVEILVGFHGGFTPGAPLPPSPQHRLHLSQSDRKWAKPSVRWNRFRRFLSPILAMA